MGNQTNIVISKEDFKNSLTTTDLETVSRKLRQVQTIEQAIAIQTPSLGAIRKMYGTQKIEVIMSLFLINLNKSINLKRKMTEEQIKECSFYICDRYSNLTIADITLIFTNAKLGKYGILYETMSMDKIMTWFDEYFNKRCDIFIKKSQSEHEYTKNHSSNPVLQVLKKAYDENGIEMKVKKENPLNGMPYTIEDLNKLTGRNENEI